MAQSTEDERHEASMRPTPCFCNKVREHCVEGGPSCWMQVPPEFVQNYLPHKNRILTVLQNAGGETWPVQFVAEQGFVTGWAEFATGNELAIGDTLVFSFVEEANHFVVHVFGKSGCEKRMGQQPVVKPMGKRFDPAWWNSRSQEQAPALVTKGRLREMNLTPPKQKQHCKKLKRSIRESDVGEIGLATASGYHGEGDVGQSSLDSLRWDNTEAVTDLRESAEHGMNSRPLRREDVNVTPQRKPRRAPLRVPPQDSSDVGAVETEKRRRGRPLKIQVPGSTPDSTWDPFKDIYESRRRKVTQAERELALNSAYQLASQLHDSTTCIIVMRQSNVYRNFVLRVPRPFADRHMPDTNREVALVDSARNAWFGNWNATLKYIRGCGWQDFALEHCLEEDDALLLEYVENPSHVFTLKVHLFPVVPVPEGVTGWHSHDKPAYGSLYADRHTWLITTTGVPVEAIGLRPVEPIQPRPQRPRRRCVVNISSNSEAELTTSSSPDSSYDLA